MNWKNRRWNLLTDTRRGNAGDSLNHLLRNGQSNSRPPLNWSKSMRQNRTTAAKVRKKNVHPLVRGGVIITGAVVYMLLTGFLSPENSASLSVQSISTARQQAAGGPWVGVHAALPGFTACLTMSAGREALRNNPGRSIASRQGDWILITERIKVGILSLLTRPRVRGQPSTPPPHADQTAREQNSGKKRYKNCLPASTNSILTPAPR